MPHYDNSDLIVHRTDWVNQNFTDYNWQSDVLQSIDLKVFFEVDEWAGSLTAQTYC